MKKPLTYLIRRRTGEVIAGTLLLEEGETIHGIQTRIGEHLCIAGGISSPTREDQCDRGSIGELTSKGKAGKSSAGKV